MKAEDFVQLLRGSNKLWLGGRDHAPRWIFRGHSDASWRLTPSAWRDLDGGNKLRNLIERFRDLPCLSNEKARPEKENLALAWVHAERFALNEFRRMAWESGYDVQEPVIESTLSVDHQPEKIDDFWLELGDAPLSQLYGFDIGLAQHYGLPTRMLDWTFNSIFSVFFAISDIDWNNVESIVNHKDIAVWALDSYAVNELYSEICGGTRNILRFSVPRRMGNDFVSAQQGVLTSVDYYWSIDFFERTGRWPSVEDCICNITGDNEFHDDGGYLFSTENDILRKIVLPGDQVYKLWFILENEGITKEKLMPSLNNISDAAIRKLNFYAEYM